MEQEKAAELQSIAQQIEALTQRQHALQQGSRVDPEQREERASSSGRHAGVPDYISRHRGPVFPQAARSRGRSDSVVSVLSKYFKTSFKPGQDPLSTERTDPFPEHQLAVPELGRSLKWVGRENVSRRAAQGFWHIWCRWQQRSTVSDDRWKEGYARVGLIGAPGTGKSTTAERLLLDALVHRSEALGPVPHESAQPYVKALKMGLQLKLQYRLDMGELGNGRHAFEQGPSPWILPQQSLALRFLFMVVREAGDTFSKFLTRVLSIEDDNDKGALLGELEARDVFCAVRLWLQDSADVTWRQDVLAFHMILDEVQTGFETEPDAQLQPHSTVQWFQAMMSAHNESMRLYEDLVVVTVAGTTMDLCSLNTLSSTGATRTWHLPMGLLSLADLQCIGEDLLNRLGNHSADGQPQVLSPNIELLSKYSGGNPRHYEALIAASVEGVLHTGNVSRSNVNLQALQGVLAGKHPMHYNNILQQAINMLTIRSASYQKWITADNGAVVRIILALSLMGTEVKRGQLLSECVPEGRDFAAIRAKLLRVGLLEGTAVLALQPCGPIMDSIEDQLYKVQLPFLMYHAWWNHAKAQAWLSLVVENYLLDTLGHVLTPEHHELADLGMVVLRLQVLRMLLGQDTCLLSDLLPLQPKHQAYATELYKVPEARAFAAGFVQLRSHTSDKEFKQLHQSLAREQQCWAFRGPGAEKRVDWWLLLQHASKDELLVVQGQSKSHRYKVVEGRADVQAEYAKRFKRTGIESLFVYVTDAHLDDAVRGDDILVIDIGRHNDFYSFVGGLRREAIFQAASADVHNKGL